MAVGKFITAILVHVHTELQPPAAGELSSLGGKKRMGAMHGTLLVAGILLGVASQASAGLVGVNWTVDSSADGLGTGTLGALGVTLTSTNGAVNGGITLPGDWPNQAGTNDVPGIAALAGANTNAIDWNAGAAGFATVSFTGGTVTNPILLFDFTDPGETFDFADGLALTILDQSPVGSVAIAAGNVVTINSSPSNRSNDGFALQLTGTFSSFTFGTNLAGLSAQSVGFSIAADFGTAAVPEPGGLALLGAACTSLAGYAGWRRRKLTASA